MGKIGFVREYVTDLLQGNLGWYLLQSNLRNPLFTGLADSDVNPSVSAKLKISPDALVFRGFFFANDIYAR